MYHIAYTKRVLYLCICCKNEMVCVIKLQKTHCTDLTEISHKVGLNPHD